MFEPQTPKEQTFSYWRNPTEDRVTADIAVGPTVPTGRIRYVWDPGETKAIPSEYDVAIRDDRGAGIVIGLAPQLEKVEEAGVTQLARSRSAAAAAQPSPSPAPAPTASEGQGAEARARRNLPPDARG